MSEFSDFPIMRQETAQRLNILHMLLGLASVLLMASLLFGYYLYAIGVDGGKIETFLLLLPIIFACLTFNYQANQMTMEAVSFYLRDHSPDKGVASGWENYWGNAKQSVQLLSFLKTLPLFLPQLLPIVLIIWHSSWPAQGIDQILTSIDLALFALILFNFRYKFKR